MNETMLLVLLGIQSLVMLIMGLSLPIIVRRAFDHGRQYEKQRRSWWETKS